MTPRERFRRVLHWEKVDRLPNLEFGYWEETIRRWHRQDLPAHPNSDAEVETYLGLEGISIFEELPIHNGMYPRFEAEVFTDKGDRLIIRNDEGNICEVLRGNVSMPRYIKYIIETKADWERLKNERLDPTREGRLGDVMAVAAEAEALGLPLFFHAGSLYGRLRNWMGVENLSVALMTERAWIEEMMDHMMGMTLFLIERALPGISVDVGWWWEDMCYSRGPLVSPALFRELMVPRYKRITDALKRYNIDVNILDCDGRIYELIPGWLDAGINCMFPIEAAHTDPLRLREEYGEELLLIGGVNKISLIEGRESIDRELERLVSLVRQGGYIPCVDHRVPPDVTFENYLYYLEKKKEILSYIAVP